MSSWLALAWRAKLVAGETVLILGATGIAGKLAVQIARLLGAGWVVAAGRNPATLAALPALGADATIQLDQADTDLTAAFAREAGPDDSAGYDVVLDYLWGRPIEALLPALTRSDLARSERRTRLVQVGATAGPTITLPAGALRGSRLEILGSGSASLPPPEVLTGYFNQMLEHAVAGHLSVETEAAPLADVEAAWQRDPGGRRLVIVP
jgi:NADPH2:quinone reductase